MRDSTPAASLAAMYTYVLGKLAGYKRVSDMDPALDSFDGNPLLSPLQPSQSRAFHQAKFREVSLQRQNVTR